MFIRQNKKCTEYTKNVVKHIFHGFLFNEFFLHLCCKISVIKTLKMNKLRYCKLDI